MRCGLPAALSPRGGCGLISLLLGRGDKTRRYTQVCSARNLDTVTTCGKCLFDAAGIIHSFILGHAPLRTGFVVVVVAHPAMPCTPPSRRTTESVKRGVKRTHDHSVCGPGSRHCAADGLLLDERTTRRAGGRVQSFKLFNDERSLLELTVTRYGFFVFSEFLFIYIQYSVFSIHEFM